MFVVADIRHPFLFWTSVILRAEADMSLTDEKLGWDYMGAPRLEYWALDIRAGETFNINARRSDGYRIGDLVPLEQVARKVPVSAGWRIVSTA